MSVRPCSLLAGIRIERGTRQDWLALAPLHYRSHHAGAVTDIFKTVWERGISSRAHCGLPEECGVRSVECGVNGDGQRGTRNAERGTDSEATSRDGAASSGFRVPSSPSFNPQLNGAEFTAWHTRSWPAATAR